MRGDESPPPAYTADHQLDPKRDSDDCKMGKKQRSNCCSFRIAGTGREEMLILFCLIIG